ncbi:hypothetical protein M514_09964 [Trichuris suis]|uniref:Uncharacterized protein n=1 Tax=Trichuris suis TaxID=68888 RepID=A0A085LVZ4_9BILA|nr:hypothetical protein M513_09964 [Trichuris suis]KFD62189.1 hypothetical protein M514_09964 [Trichuris suis]KHJ41104.1 hypothetical protein D918_08797 [Trichuris suis]
MEMESSVNTEASDFNQDTVREVMPLERDSLESGSFVVDCELQLSTGYEAQCTGQQHERSIMTDTIVLRHPRSVLICAAVQLCLAVQICVFGVICHFYDGCPYKSSLWMSTAFIFNSLLGIALVRLYPKRLLLVIYSCADVLSLMLSVFLFSITAWLLDQQEKEIRQQGWHPSQSLTELNRIIENTKIAMYTLHMVFTPAHAICTIVSSILCFYNLTTPQEELHRGYYVSRTAHGHQTVLLPMNVRTGAISSETERLLDLAEQQSHIASKGTQTTTSDRKILTKAVPFY